MPEQVLSRHEVFDRFDATTGWAAFNSDATGLATTTTHIAGTAALTFNKANGAANTVLGAIAKTISQRTLEYVNAKDVLRTTFYVSSIANVAYAFIRLGTSASHYNEWRIDDSDIQAGWNTVDVRVGEITSVTGNGWNPLAITYMVVGIGFDAETDTLNGIIFDEVSWHSSMTASVDVQTQVTLSGSNVSSSAIGAATTWITSGDISADYTSAAIDLTTVSGPFYLLLTFDDNSAGELYVKGSTSSTVANHIPITLTSVDTDNVAATQFLGPASSIGILDPGASGVKLLIAFEHPPAPYVSIFFDRTGGSATGLNASYYTQSV